MKQRRKGTGLWAVLLAFAVLLGSLILPAKEAEAAGTPSVVYSAHVQSYGWMEEVQDGGVGGTIGERKRVEAFRIHISGNASLGVAYQTHVQKIGWQNEVSDGTIAGTTGMARRVEAIKIRLTGADANKYDIYYCAHVQSIGWTDWVKNGEQAGTTGRGLRMEAVSIKLLPKGSPAPVSLKTRNYAAVSLSYRSHVQKKGWMGWVKNGAECGAAGEGLRMEALEMSLWKGDFTGGITYRAHVQGIGWQNWVTEGKGAGTTGQARRVEAIEAKLTGELAGFFDVYYRAYVQEWGWTGWAKNGESCGSTGIRYRLEAFEIKLVKKGDPAPSREGTILYREAKPAPPAPEPEPAKTEEKYSPDIQAFLNRAQGYSSYTGYLIMVSRPAHIVAVFQGSYGNWTLVRLCACSVGKPETPTITGDYHMCSKVLHFGDEEGYRCWYASGILGNYLMHSGTYAVTESPDNVLDDRMGMNISHGCVRMELENAKWIYYNVPVGTLIHIE